LKTKYRFGGAALVAESLGIGDCQFGNVQRPLEPDTVNTVEGRNSHPLTVPSFLILGGTVFVLLECPTNFSLSLRLEHESGSTTN
jgi:hypothetical protein